MDRFQPTALEQDFEEKYAGEHVNWLYEQCKYLAFPLTEKHLSAWTGEERAEQADEAHADMEDALDQYLDQNWPHSETKAEAYEWALEVIDNIVDQENTKYQMRNNPQYAEAAE